MKNFFIIGLPRTRTAWLANFLTNGDGFCFHEAMRTCSNLDELKAKMATECRDTVTTVGDADPSLCQILPEVIAKFPEAKIVVINRATGEAYESYMLAFPALAPKYEDWSKAQEKLLNFLSVPKNNVMDVAFDDLAMPAICDDIHQFCLGRPMDTTRWEMLDEMRITVLAEKAYTTMAPWAKAYLSYASNPLNEACKDWYALIAQLCGNNAPARDWLGEVWAAALAVGTICATAT